MEGNILTITHKGIGS